MSWILFTMWGYFLLVVNRMITGLVCSAYNSEASCKTIKVASQAGPGIYSWLMVKLYGWLPQLAWSNQPAICSIVVLATLTASSVARLFKPARLFALLWYWPGYLRLPRIFIAFGPGFDPGLTRLLMQWRKSLPSTYMIKISSKQVKQFFLFRSKWS